MQTGKKEDRNTFFSQIADDCSFTFAGRQNVPRQPTGCHHAAPSPYILHLLYIYLSISRNGKCRKGGKRQPLSKVSDYFANSNARVSTKLLSLPKQFYRKTYNGK